MRCFSIILLFLSAIFPLAAQTVDSVAVYSPAMQRDVKNYWNLSIPHHLQFFDEYFNGKNTYEMKIRYTND